MNYSKQTTILLLLVFISFFGVTLPFPLFAPMIMDSPRGTIVPLFVPDSMRPLLLGVLLASYPLGQFFGASYLGGLSDRIGRRPAMMISVVNGMLGFLFTGLCIYFNRPLLLILSRFYSGLFEGNVAIAQATFSDMQNKIDKAKGFSYIYVASTLGYTFGPIVGGVLAELTDHQWVNYAMPFWCSSIFGLLALLITKYHFQETLNLNTSSKVISKQRQLSRSQSPSGLQALTEVLRQSMADLFDGMKKIIYWISRPLTGKVIVLAFLMYLGLENFYEFYPLFFVKNFKFTPLKIAYLTLLYTIPYMLCQYFFVPRSSRAKNLYAFLGTIAFIASILFLALGASKELWQAAIPFFAIGIFMAFITTNLSVAVSNTVSPSEQGSALGALLSLRTLSDAIVCFLGGAIALKDVNYPFIMSAVFYFLAAIGLARMAKKRIIS